LDQRGAELIPIAKMASLFPSQAPKTDHMVEFKAGRMVRDGKMLKPENRKGLIYLYRSDDSLIHFCWKDRTTHAVIEDLIVFAGDAIFKKVSKTSQRVYMLEFTTSERKLFFWMQEAKDTQDRENVCKVNHILCHGPQEGDDPFEGMQVDEKEKKSESLETDATPATLPPAPSQAHSSASPTADYTALQELLSGIRLPDQVELPCVLRQEVVQKLLDQAGVVEQLAPFLPSSVPKSKSGIESVLRSPQFVQAVQAFNAALKSGQVDASSFGIRGSSDGRAAGVEAFLQAVQAEADQSKASPSKDDQMEQ